MTTTATGAELVVEALRREDVTHVFGLPGTTIMELIDALGDQPAIRYIAVRHEQVAAFMADGYARGSGSLGVCLASRGPGAANLSIGVHNAHAEAVPVLALVGQVADRYAHRDAFEEMDLLGFFGPVTKWGVEIHEAPRIPELLQRACRVAESGRPGAVLVSLPHDVITAPVEDVGWQVRWRGAPPAPNLEEAQQAATLLRGAEHPVVLLGGGVRSHDPAVLALASRLGAPVVTTWLRKGSYPSGASNALGALGYGALPATEDAIKQADVILALGTKFSEFTTNKWTLLREDQQVIHVDVDTEALGRVYVPTVGILADANATATVLHDQLPDVPPSGRVAWTAALRERFVAESAPPTQEPRPGLVSSYAVTRALQDFVDVPGHVLVADAPGFGTWIHRYITFDQPDSFYGAAGGSMGWGFPAAMGLKLARPEAQFVVVAGDGSFWMVAQDLETAVRENIPLVVVVTNNFSFGNTRDRQRFAFEGRFNGVFYDNPDFAKFAQLLGAYGERVEDDDQLAAALDRALASGRPAVIDVIQDRMEGLPPGLVPPGVARQSAK